MTQRVEITDSSEVIVAGRDVTVLRADSVTFNHAASAPAPGGCLVACPACKASVWAGATRCPRCAFDPGLQAARLRAQRQRESAFAIMLWCLCAGVALQLAVHFDERGFEAWAATAVLGTCFWALTTLGIRRLVLAVASRETARAQG